MTREEVIKIFNGLLLFGKAPCKKEELEDLCKIVLAALEQEPRKGHWIFAGEENEEETKNGNFRYVCSECCRSDVHAKTTEVPYCWYCGAKMAEIEG